MTHLLFCFLFGLFGVWTIGAVFMGKPIPAGIFGVACVLSALGAWGD